MKKQKKSRKKKKEKVIIIKENNGKGKEKINDENYTIEIMSGDDNNGQNIINNNYPLSNLNKGK